MDLVRERLDGVLQERRGVHLAGLVVELDEGELRDAVDGEEHVELAVRVAKLAAVDVDVADRRLGKAAPRLSSSRSPADVRCRVVRGSDAELDRVSFGI